MKFRNLKRAITLILVFTITFSCVQWPGTFISEYLRTAAVESFNENDSYVSDELQIKSTNSFGDLLTTPLKDKFDEQSGENSDFCVYSVEIKDNSAIVSYTSLFDCNLTVAIYDNDGRKMYTSASTKVKSSENETIIEIQDVLPEYYLVKAYLTISDSLAPLCQVYENNMYTEHMQSFLSKTISDFEEDRVLCLDEEETSNFAVFSEDVIVIENETGYNTVSSCDNENGVYIIDNINNTVASLQPGDVFAYNYNNINDMIIVKIDTIDITENTATIRAAETSIEEVFDHLRYEVDDAMEHANFDTNGIPNVLYSNFDDLNDYTIEETARVNTSSQIVETSSNLSALPNPMKNTSKPESKLEFDATLDVDTENDSVTGTGSITANIAFTPNLDEFDTSKTIKTPYGELPAAKTNVAINTSFTGSATVTLKASIKIYFAKDDDNNEATKNRYVEVKFINKTEFYADFDTSINVSIPLWNTYFPYYGFCIEFTPKIVINTTGKAEVSAVFTSTKGVEFKNGQMKRINPKGEVDIKFNGEVTVTVKLDIGPKCYFISEKLATVDTEFSFGIRVNAKLELEKEYSYEEDSENGTVVIEDKIDKHDCSTLLTEGDCGCIKGTVTGVGAVAGEIKFLNSSSFKLNLLKAELHLLDFYYSLKYNEFGKGICPHKFYYYELNINDINGDKIEDAEVYVSEKSYKTDKNGKVLVYLSPGENKVKINKENYKEEELTLELTSSYNTKYKNDSGLGFNEKVESESTTTANKSDSATTQTTVSTKKVNVDLNIADISYDIVDTVKINDSEERSKDITLTGQPHTVTVHVVDKNGTLVKGSYVDSNYSDPDSTIDTGHTINSTGVFNLLLPDGTYTLTAGKVNDLSVISKISVDVQGEDTAAVIELACIEEEIPESTTDATTGDNSELSTLQLPEYGKIMYGTRDIRGIPTFHYLYFTCINGELRWNVEQEENRDYTQRYSVSLSGLDVRKLYIIGNPRFYPEYSECNNLTYINYSDGNSPGDYDYYTDMDFYEDYIFLRVDGDTVEIKNPVSALKNLKEIYVDPDNSDYCTVDGVLFNKDKTELIKYPSNSEYTEYVIPDTVTTIASGAFLNCKNLEKLEIPNSVTKIEKNAFSGNCNIKVLTSSFVDCDTAWKRSVESLTLTAVKSNQTISDLSALKQVTVAGSIKVVEGSLFENCESLENVYIANNVTSIGKSAFKNCKNLSEITIPNTVTSIGDSAFYNCINLSEIIIPDSVTEIGEFVFVNCEKLPEITIPDNVTSIGNKAFGNCENLSKISIPDSAELGTNIFYNDNDVDVTIRNIDGTVNFYQNWVSKVTVENGIETVDFRGCTTLRKVILPDSITSIGDMAFSSCRSLESITIPDSVTEMGGGVFYGCLALRNVTLSNNITSLDYYYSSSVYYGLFEGCTSLESITISDNITTIGIDTFKGCTSLTSVIIHDSVTKIGKNAFYDCSSLEKVRMSSEVTYSSFKYLFNSNNMIRELSVPDTLTIYDKDYEYVDNFEYLEKIEIRYKSGTVGEEFSEELDDNKSINEVIIEDKITVISNNAFKDCNNLKKVSIPDSITKINSKAFYNCESIENVYISDLGAWCNIEFADYASNPVYYADNFYLNGKIVTDIVIPDSVTSIGDYAFNELTSLMKITIPDNVTSIGDYAFKECTSLESIVIPASVTSIGDYAFKECTSLESVAISDGVTRLGEYAFSGCSSFESVTLPDSITSVSKNAFSGCTSLESLYFPDTVNYIDASVLNNCPNLKFISVSDSISISGTDISLDECEVEIRNVTGIFDARNFNIIPKGIIFEDGIETIDAYASLRISEVYIPASVTTIGNLSGRFQKIEVDENNANYCSIDGVLYDKDITHLVKYPSYKKSSKYIMPLTVKTIAANAFVNCSYIKTICVPDILELWHISNDNRAYDEIKGLSKLEYITVIKTNSTHFNSYLNCSVNGILTNGTGLQIVPKNYFLRYKNVEHLDLSNENYLTDIDFSGFTNLKSVILPNNIKEIGDYAFDNCINLESIVIPDTVEKIGGYAFRNCTSLKNVIIPDSVITIGYSAFENCTSLENVYISDIEAWFGIAFENNKSTPLCYADNLYLNDELVINIVIPKGVTSIGSYALYNCVNLKSITLPDTITNISDSFSGCSNLESINVSVNNINYSSEAGVLYNKEKTELIKYPASKLGVSYAIKDCVTSIRSNAFAGCTNLTSIDIPVSVTSIESNAFVDCTNLVNITIPESVTSVGSKMFANCTSLTSITLPNCVTSIGYHEFSGCTSLKSITIPDSVTSIESYAFGGCDFLECIYVSENNLNYSSDGGVLYNKDKTKVIKIPDNLTEWRIPDTVENFKSDVIPAGIKVVYCSGKVNSSIYDDPLFKNCTDVEIHFTSDNSSVDIERNVTKVVIEDGVTSIKNGAFSNSIDLESIIIPDSITSIGDYAFRDCKNLASITLPDSVTTIGNGVFSGCESLESVNVTENNTNYSSIDGVLFNKEQTKLIYYPKGKTDKSYFVPNTVTKLWSNNFKDGANFESISIPESVKVIESSAFEGCSNLKTIITEDNLDYTFENGALLSDSGVVCCLNTNDVEFTLPNSCSLSTIIKVISSYPNAKLSADNRSYTMENYVLYDKDKTTLHYYFPFEKSVSYSIPDSITENEVTIANDFLKVLTIPHSIEKITLGINYKKLIVLNPDCIISGIENADSSAVIYGFKNSTAQAYAKAYNLRFCDISTGVMSDYADEVITLTSDVAESAVYSVDSISMNESLFSLKLLSNETETIEATEEYVQTDEYTDLRSNYIYNLYVVKSLNTDCSLSNDDLLYINQYVSNEEGGIIAEYIPKEVYDGMVKIMVPIYEKEIDPFEEIDTTERIIEIGDTIELGNYGAEILYYSEDENVLNVNEHGTVTALSSGESAIIAMSVVGESISIPVKVNERLMAEETDVTLELTDNYKLKLSRHDVTFESSDENVCIINEDGEVIINGSGIAEIMITDSFGANVVVTITVNEDLEISDTEIKINKNEQYQIVANRDDVLFEISDETIATVDETGLVTAVSVGNAVVLVTDSTGKEITINVIVEEMLTVEETIIFIDENDVFQIISNKDNLNYVSEDETIAQVSQNGLITAISSGEVIITVTDDTGASQKIELIIEKELINVTTTTTTLAATTTSKTTSTTTTTSTPTTTTTTTTTSIPTTTTTTTTTSTPTTTTTTTTTSIPTTTTTTTTTSTPATTTTTTTTSTPATTTTTTTTSTLATTTTTTTTSTPTTTTTTTTISTPTTTTKSTTITATTTTFEQIEYNYIYGDVNLDCMVNKDDEKMLASYLSKDIVISPAGLFNADVNKDDEISDADLIILNMFINDQISVLPYTGELPEAIITTNITMPSDYTTTTTSAITVAISTTTTTTTTSTTSNNTTETVTTTLITNPSMTTEITQAQVYDELINKANKILEETGTTPIDIYGFVSNNNKYRYIEETRTLDQIESKGWDYFANYAMNNRYVVQYYFAAITELLFQCAGYESRIVYGTGRGTGDHYWNQIMIDGEWINYDACNGYYEVDDDYLKKQNYTFKEYLYPRFVPTIESEYLLGDVNNDGSVDSSDASLVLAEYAKIQTGGAGEFTETQFKAADVNKDDVVDSSDASKILAYYAMISTGKEPTWD